MFANDPLDGMQAKEFNLSEQIQIKAILTLVRTRSSSTGISQTLFTTPRAINWGLCYLV